MWAYTIMIWLNRVLSIPVGVVFLVLLLLTLVMLQVSDTFLDPDYYPEQLREANIYEFVLNDLLASAIDERRVWEAEELARRERESEELVRREQPDAAGTGQSVTSTPLISSGLTTAEIVASVNRAVPPDWVQELAEQSFDEIGRYLMGERDEFVVTVRARQQVPILVDEIKSLLRKADAYNLLYDREVVPAIESSLTVKLPLGIEITSDRMVQAARAVAPPEWVQEQVEIALDEVTPYFIGDRDTFEINVQLVDRVEIAVEEIKKLLRETTSGELLYDEVVEPELKKSWERPFSCRWEWRLPRRKSSVHCGKWLPRRGWRSRR